MLLTATLVSVFLSLCASPDADRDTLQAATAVGVRQGRAVLDAGAPKLEVGTAAIERSGARELHEVLRTLPGLNVQDYGGIGGLKTVSVRGLGATHTAVCYDGALVSDAQRGSIDLSQFDLDNTGGIAVEIGTPDDIFLPAGTSTAGSVLSIMPKPLDFSGGPTHAEAAWTWGSFGTIKPAVRIDRKIRDGWGVSVCGSYLRSDGDYPFTGRTITADGALTEPGRLRREGSDVSTFKSTLRLEGHDRRGGTFRASADWLDSDRGLPGPVILYTQDPTERLRDRDLTTRSSYDRTSGEWRLRLDAGYRRFRTRYTDISPVYAEPVDDRYLQQIGSLGAVLGWRHSLGADAALQAVLAQDLRLSHLAANTAACPQPTRLGSITAVSAQYAGPRLKATVSLTATLMREWVEVREAAPDRHRLSPSASISFAAAPGVHLRAFAKEGFRVPTFNDLYYDRVGSISLVPEKARQAGLGATWHRVFGRADLAVTADAYHNDVTDKIIAVPTMFVWRMRNLGRVRMDGIDLSAAVTLPLGTRYTFHTDASWSFLDAADVSDPSAKNYRHQIQYTPRHSGAVSASVGTSRASLGYTLCAVGPRWYLPQNIPANRLPSCFDHTLAVRWRIPVRRAVLTLSAEALNLSGVTYEIVRSYPMPGRQLRITAKITQ